MSRLALRVVLIIAALVSCVLFYQTARNLVEFVQTTREIEVELTELCPIGEDSYQLDVVVRNNSEHTVTVEGFIFQVHNEDRLIASIVQLEEVSIRGFGHHTEPLLLTTNLEPARRPENLESCGFAPGWTASGYVRINLPFARGDVKLQASAGGD